MTSYTTIRTSDYLLHRVNQKDREILVSLEVLEDLENHLILEQLVLVLPVIQAYLVVHWVHLVHLVHENPLGRESQ